MKGGDAKRRMFVGQGYTVRSGLERAYSTLEHILDAHPQVIALLEFTSRGDQHRQIDCALVGPGGIDLIEIKNKHGIVRGTADGAWTVTSQGVTEGFSNLKNRVEENPFMQARNSADDLRSWLERFWRIKLRVSPMVWLPSAEAASVIERDSFVWHAVGLRAFAGKLRAIDGKVDPWGRHDYRELPQLFGLKPMDLASVSGRVVDHGKHAGVAGVQVIVRVNGSSEQFSSDPHGQFDFMVTKGVHFEVAFAVPGLYVAPPILASVAELDYTYLPKIVLDEQPPQRTEEELLAQARRQVQEELEAHVAEQVRRSEALRHDDRAQADAVIGRLTDQLREAQLKLVEREQLLAQQAAQLPALPLPVQVAQVSQTTTVQWQQRRVTEALEQLSAPGGHAGSAFARGVDVLAQITHSRHTLTFTPPPASALTHVLALPREPLHVDGDDPDVQDAVFEELGPVPHPQPPAPNEGAPLPPQTAAVPLPRAPRWPMVTAGLALVTLVGLGALWYGQHAGTPPTAGSPAIAAPLDAEPLPGTSIDADPDANGLPGTPVQDR